MGRKAKKSLVDEIVVEGATAYLLTPLGIEVVRELGLLHCTDQEIADHLGLKVSEWKAMKDPEGTLYDPGAHEAVLEGMLEFKKKLRQHQFELSATNAQMAKFLGTQYLDQKEKAEVEHNHKHAIIGTLPNYEVSSDEWKRQFAPDTVLKVDEQKRIEMKNVEEAEIVNVETNDDED